MFCSNCGNETSENAKFCGYCGNRLNNTNLPFPHQSGSTISRSSNRKSLITSISIALIVLIIAGLFYFNSKSFLEKRLTSKTWYQHPDIEYMGRYIEYGSIVDFYSNGESESVDYVRYEDNWISRGPVESPNWEIMNDKTLYFDGDYYEWKEEWNFRGKYLHIGDTTYYSKDIYNYNEDE